MLLYTDHFQKDIAVRAVPSISFLKMEALQADVVK